MTPPRVRATLPDGRVIEGPIGGIGWMVGAGAFSQAGAVRAVERALRVAAKHSEPILIYPDCRAAGDGDPVAVPVRGAVFGVVTEVAP